MLTSFQKPLQSLSCSVSLSSCFFRGSRAAASFLIVQPTGHLGSLGDTRLNIEILILICPCLNIVSLPQSELVVIKSMHFSFDAFQDVWSYCVLSPECSHGQFLLTLRSRMGVPRNALPNGPARALPAPPVSPHHPPALL